MKTPIKRAPAALPPAVSELVAEGGNVLAADDALTEKPANAEIPKKRLRRSEYSFDADIVPAGEARGTRNQ